MFVPIRDSTFRLTPPYVTVGLVVANCLVFIYQVWLPAEALQEWFYSLGVVPERLRWGNGLINLITSLFLHADPFHLGGNMLYLWIFGDNIETTLGHGKFLLFYLTCGVVATLTQVIIIPDSELPIIGASGAISGVLGAYLIRYPRARVKVLVWLLVFIRYVWIPAGYLLSFWFLMQLTNGLGALSSTAQGGVAWFAHIGGFLAGVGLLYLILPYERKRIWKKIKQSY